MIKETLKGGNIYNFMWVIYLRLEICVWQGDSNQGFGSVTF